VWYFGYCSSQFISAGVVGGVIIGDIYFVLYLGFYDALNAQDFGFAHFNMLIKK
jgi:hypothetical protein